MWDFIIYFQKCSLIKYFFNGSYTKNLKKKKRKFPISITQK